MNSWFSALVTALPKLKNRIQLTGLLVGIAAVVAMRVAAPQAVVAQVCAGAIGVAFIVFAQVFPYLGSFPIEKRVKLVVTLFVVFAVFVLFLIGVILVSLRRSPPSGYSTIGFPKDRSLDAAIGLVKDEFKIEVDWSSTCKEQVHDATISAGQYEGNSLRELLDSLQWRVKGPRIKYHVNTLKEEVRYEIICD